MNSYLKIFNINVAIKREIVDDERLRLRDIDIKLHQNECVERIDRRHQKRLPVPIVRSFAQWTQGVVAPGVTLVVAPGVEKLRFHTPGHSPRGGILASRRARYLRNFG